MSSLYSHPKKITEKNNWQSDRRIALNRDGFKCVECDEEDDLHVHHLIPRARGGNNEPGNLITLCGGCHAARHPTLQVSLSRSFIERWAIRIARLFDTSKEIPSDSKRLAIALLVFKTERFREGQLNVILAALRGDSVLVIRPTGSGKSLCFQVPALIKPGTAYVLSPLKALMSDQIIGLQKLKIPSTFINSDLTTREKKERFSLLENGSLKFLYVTPERFDINMVRNAREISLLCKRPPNFLVIDEAHCVDKWGEDFRTSYGRLAQVRKELGSPPLLAFTATAGPAARRRILKSLGIPHAKVFVSGFDRPNIGMVRCITRSEPERLDIAGRIISRFSGKAMIFVPTIKIGIQVQQGLEERGISIPFYHGKRSTSDKDFLLGQFLGQIEPEINDIICTNAFGMGIDVPNVRFVFHWVQPESVEDYLQEFGRAGRDGKSSAAIIFKEKGDTGLRKFMAEKTAEEAEKKGIDGSASLKRKLDSIFELDRIILNTRKCFRRQLMESFDQDREAARSLSVRILEWVFGGKKSRKASGFCCDYCDPKIARELLRK